MTVMPHPSVPPSQLRLSVAPMMDWTDTHCRVFHRVLAPHAKFPSVERASCTFGAPMLLTGNDYAALAAEVEDAVRSL